MSDVAAERHSSEAHSSHHPNGAQFGDIFSKEHSVHHRSAAHFAVHLHDQLAHKHSHQAHKAEPHHDVKQPPQSPVQQVETFFTNIYKDVQQKQRETQQWSNEVDRNMKAKLNNLADEFRREQDHLDDEYNPIKWIGNKLNNL